tara:strand:+ start:1096 stop:1311 length:216 start_codon:yes stop_codon:yes gene_type:complete
MDLNDIFNKNRYSAENDKSTLIAGDTRKVKLTLEQVNKLRRIKEAKKFEEFSKLQAVKAQYGKPSDDSGGL